MTHLREPTPIQESLFGFPEFDWNNPCDLNPEKMVEPFIGRSSWLTHIHPFNDVTGTTWRDLARLHARTLLRTRLNPDACTAKIFHEIWLLKFSVLYVFSIELEHHGSVWSHLEHFVELEFGYAVPVLVNDRFQRGRMIITTFNFMNMRPCRLVASSRDFLSRPQPCISGVSLACRAINS
jgi:hypothetical protein